MLSLSLLLCLWVSCIQSFSLSPLSARSRTDSSSRLYAITNVQSPYELSELVHSNELTVVCFHANWCKSCQKFQQYYRKLDASNPPGLQLANVEYSVHTDLAKSLGVERLPSVQFYHQGRRLDAFNCGPKNFARELGTIQCLQDEIQSQRQFTVTLEEGAALMQRELGTYGNAVQPLSGSTTTSTDASQASSSSSSPWMV